VSRPIETVVAKWLEAQPVVPAEASSLLLAGVELKPRPVVPAWIADPGLRADIILGLADIPDDLYGEAP